MSVNSKVTAIADKIRALLGLSGKMGLDAMATNLGTEQTNIANAFTAVGNKGGTVPSSKVSGNLATAINSIPIGATIQRKTGSFTTDSSGKATVNCGFKPDAVFLTGKAASSSDTVHTGAAFYDGNITTVRSYFSGSSRTYVRSDYTVKQTSNGFTVEGKRLNTSFTSSADSKRSVGYIAIKYT